MKSRLRIGVVAILVILLGVLVTAPEQVRQFIAGTSKAIGPAAGSPHALAGRWRAELPLEDGTSAALYLDIGWFDGRWIGECDFEAFDLADFALNVVVRDSTIHLDFGGADASFDGHLTSAPPRIAGILTSGSGPVGLVFSREGEASLSEGLLSFERAPEDSSRLLKLSRSGAELRAMFNRDRGKTRLIVLLSPT